MMSSLSEERSLLSRYGQEHLLDGGEKLAFPGLDAPALTVLELPWEADYITPERLREKLIRSGFPSHLRADCGYLAASEFKKLQRSVLNG